MATTKQFGLSGIGADVQLGKGGIRLINTTGEFHAHAADGAAYTNISAAAPSLPNHVATKTYVDALSSGLDPKQSVQAREAVNQTGYSELGTGLGTVGHNGHFVSQSNIVDGFTLADGDRVLVTGQTDQTENGIYVVTTAGVGSDGVWDRATDSDSSPSNEVSAGNYTFVESGASYANSGWVLEGDGNIEAGVGIQSWVQFSGAGSLTAGIGLLQTGTTFDIDMADAGLVLATGDTLLADTVIIGDSADGFSTKKATFTDIFADLDVVTVASATPGLVVSDGAGGYTSAAVTASALDAAIGISVTGGDTAPVIGLDIIGTPANAEPLALTDSIIAYDLSLTANKQFTFQDMITDLDLSTGGSLAIEGPGALDGLSLTTGTFGLDIQNLPAATTPLTGAESFAAFDGAANVNIDIDDIVTYVASAGTDNAILEGDTSITILDGGVGQIDTVVDGVHVAKLDAASGYSLSVGAATPDSQGINIISSGDDLSTTISTIALNEDLILAPNGTGEVIIGSSGSPAQLVAEDGQDLTVASGAGVGGVAGDLYLSGGDSDGASQAGNVIIAAGQATPAGATDGITFFKDAEDNTVATIENLPAGQVDYISLTAGGTIGTLGTSTNIDFTIDAKGTGLVLVTEDALDAYKTSLETASELALVTKGYVDDAITGNVVPGAMASVTGTVSLATNATGVIVGAAAIPAGAIVTEVKVLVGVLDTAATLTIGNTAEGPAGFMAATENDAQNTGLYVADAFVTNSAAEIPTATVASTGGAGSATVIITYMT